MDCFYNVFYGASLPYFQCMKKGSLDIFLNISFFV